MARSTKQDSVGAPSKLTEEVTKKICDALRMTAYIDTAVLHSGVSVDAYYKWLKRGHDEKFRLEQYRLTKESEKELDADRVKKMRADEKKRRAVREKEHRATKRKEARYVLFVDEIDKALADGELGALSIIAKSAKGSAVLERRTTVNADGSKTITEKLAPPIWNAAAWMLERRSPNKYARMERREISGPESGPVEVKTWAEAVKEAFEGDDPDDDFEGS